MLVRVSVLCKALPETLSSLTSPQVVDVSFNNLTVRARPRNDNIVKADNEFSGALKRATSA